MGQLKTDPIAELQRALFQEFERDARGSRVARMLGEYAAAHDDWKRFAMFDPQVYTRNLVGRNEHFEMLLLCWNVGQQSPIHNHAGQNCWMGVMEGEIEETLFAPPQGGRAGPLVPTHTRVHLAGKVGFINDDIALHRVRPVTGQRGISLHLYSKPIDECNVYDEASGCIVSSRLVYHSVEGIATGNAGAVLRR
jgi:cysteine dioxygenase